MTNRDDFRAWNELARKMLLARLTDDDQGRAFAMALMVALVRDGKLVDIISPGR